MPSLSSLNQIVINHLGGRDRRLPRRVLHRYLHGFLRKKDRYLESALKFGTPQYLFDLPSLTEKTTLFRNAFSRHIKRFQIFYALKSNPFPGICRQVVSQGLGIDVSSGLELSIALNSGCGKIIFSGPGKRDEEILYAIDNRERVTLLMDSFGELDRTSKILQSKGAGNIPLKVGIRIQHLGKWNKFGIPLRDLAGFFKRASGTAGLDLRGIQFHTSWNLDPAAQIHMIDQIGSYLRCHVPPRLIYSLSFLDIGGGFWPAHGEWLNPQNSPKGRLLGLLKVSGRPDLSHYYRKGRPIDSFFREIGAAIKKQGSVLKDLEIWAEPGRWISTPAMHILLQVIDKKETGIAITDGGTNLLGWERPLYEFIPVINLTNPAPVERPVRIFGSLCTPDDIWGISVFGSNLCQGDFLLFPDQGAYTYSLRQSFIKPVAKVVQYDGKEFTKVKEEEGGFDYLDR